MTRNTERLGITQTKFIKSQTRVADIGITKSTQRGLFAFANEGFQRAQLSYVLWHHAKRANLADQVHQLAAQPLLRVL